MNEHKKNGRNCPAGQTAQNSIRHKTKTSRGQGDRISARSRRRAEEARRRRRTRFLIQGIFLGFCVCLLCFSIYQLASIFLGYRSGDKEYEDLKQYVLQEPAAPEDLGITAPVSDEEKNEEEDSSASVPVPMSRIDLDALQKINPDAIGWIEIPDTIISYPMVHGDDNLYYLRHTFRKEENKSGSIFLETSNQADFSDLHTIIYGHNMKNGSMFAGLKEYSSQSYLASHPYVYIDLTDGSHCYQIFSCHEAGISDNCYTIGYERDDVYAAFLESLKSASLYDTGVDVSTDDMVITLSTCTKNGTKRFVVHAKKIY